MGRNERTIYGGGSLWSVKEIFECFQTQFERTVNFEKQLYKVVEEFHLELIHSSEASELAKKLYVSLVIFGGRTMVCCLI